MARHWSLVSERDAVAYAGRHVELLHGEYVSYAWGTAATVVILDAGDRPDGTGLWSRERVVLRDLLSRSVAERVDADPRNEMSILGFVRLPDGCLPLGRLRLSQGEYVQVGKDDDRPWPGENPYRLAECHLLLDDLLPWDALDLARPVAPQQLPEPSWITHLPHDAVHAMRTFIDIWYAEVPKVSDDLGDLPQQLPAPLLEVYRAVAGRDELLGEQDGILAPGQIRPLDGRLLFGTGDQGDFGTQQPLSRILLQCLLTEAAVGSPFGGIATVTNEQERQLSQLLQQVPLRPVCWPTGPTHHYVGPGIVVMVRGGNDGSANVWVGSRWRSALRPLRQPGFAWHQFDG